jgi:hypothetical protein
MTCRADALTRQDTQSWLKSFESQKWRNTHNTLHDQLVDKKSCPRLVPKELQTTTQCTGLSHAFDAHPQSKESSSCSSLLYGMKYGLITQHSRQTKIISPGEDIQSNTVSKEHHDNCLERPQRFASCIFPWPRWYYQVTVVQLRGYGTPLITKALDRWSKHYHFARQHQVPQNKTHMWLVMALGATAGRLWTSLSAAAASLWWLKPLWTPYKRPGRQTICNRLRHEASCHLLTTDNLHWFPLRRDPSLGGPIETNA